MQEIRTIVIGAGQAGLSVAYWLQKNAQDYLILESGTEAGYSWRKRYDSLRLFTPARYSSLPGMDLTMPENSYPSKDDVADYMNDYVRNFQLNVRYNCSVKKLEKQSDKFILYTDQDTFQCEHVVVATGAFKDPYLPAYSTSPDNTVTQIHSSEYHNPGELNRGTVLVVGAGNSAAQIAEEVAAHYPTYMVVRNKIAFTSLNVLGVSSFFWAELFGVMKASRESLTGRLLMRKGEGVYADKLQRLIEEGKVITKPGIQSFNGDNVIFEDGTALEVATIIWATGFKNNYNWINILGVVNENGTLIHNKGISKIKGLYFIGLPWQTSRGSSLILGAGRDAEMIVNDLIRNGLPMKILQA